MKLRTNIVLDDDLVKEAQALSQIKTMGVTRPQPIFIFSAAIEALACVRLLIV